MDKRIHKIKNKITILKLKLQRSDYKAIKFAEGEITASDYAPIREQRKAWRAEINALEAELKMLNEERTENDAD